MHILAVDDDPVILELISEVVPAMGNHTVTTVDSAQTALDYLCSDTAQPVDCFLLDIKMPGMNGIELCDALRQSGHFTFVPIIMLTAMSDKASIDGAFAAGASDFVRKPFEMFELEHRIRRAESRTEHLRQQLEALERDGDSARKPGLLEQIQVYDVDNMIDYFALENYVPMLSRRSLFGSVVLGFHIREVEDIYGMCTNTEFRGLIADVAETISDALRDYQFLMAYAGNGTFLCVIEECRVPKRTILVDQINFQLQRLDIQVPTPRGLPVRICCGEMVRLLGHTPGSISTALIDARGRAEANGRALEREFDSLFIMPSSA
ncbi:response regulator [Pseudoponticoccus marisrubri]|uniref:Response regulatory domain-containing protein n=1 Tax=Pseudoponticoccus marisrubri TaxID=1685382 RepID=A0A0W7WIF3_9RHOB|nr:response regulator [Pseudoponticoccus marisrubri]KUF10386.1 hypothetical protein AVJ23_13390 [Pseudoponticoccus marisrubri]